MRQIGSVLTAALACALLITCGARTVFAKPMPPRFFYYTYEFFPALQPGPVTLRVTLYDTTGCTDITAEFFHDDNMGYSGPKTFTVIKTEQEPSVTIDLPVVLPENDTCGFWMKFESSCGYPQWAGRFWVTGPDSVEVWTHDVRVYAINTGGPEIRIDSSVQKWEDSLMANPSKPGRLVYYDEYGNETDQEGAIKALRDKANVMGYHPVPEGWVWVRDDTGGVYAVSPEQYQQMKERAQIERYSSDIDPLDSTQAPLLDADGQTIQIHGEFWTRQRGERAFHKLELIPDIHDGARKTYDSLLALAGSKKLDVILDLRDPTDYETASSILDHLEPTDSVGYYRTTATLNTLKQLRQKGIRDAEYPYLPRDPKDNNRRRPPKQTLETGSAVDWMPVTSSVAQRGRAGSNGRSFDMPIDEQKRRRQNMLQIEQQPPERENLYSILIGDEEWLRFPKCRNFCRNDGLVIYEDNLRGAGFNDSLPMADGSVYYDAALDLRDPDRAQAIRGIVDGLAPMEKDGYFHALVISEKLGELRWRGIEFAEYPHYPISLDELMDRHVHGRRTSQLLPEDDLRTVPDGRDTKVYLINPNKFQRACEITLMRDLEKEPLEGNKTQLVKVMGEQWIRYPGDSTFQKAVVLTDEEMRDPNNWYRDSLRTLWDTLHMDIVMDLRQQEHLEAAQRLCDSLVPMEKEGYFRAMVPGKIRKELHKAGIFDSEYPNYPVPIEERLRRREEREKRRREVEMQQLRELEKEPLKGRSDQAVMVDGELWLRAPGDSLFHKSVGYTKEELKVVAKQHADSVRQWADTALHDVVLDLSNPELLEKASRIADSLVPTERAGYYRTEVRGDKLLQLRKLLIRWSIYPNYPTPPPKSTE